MTTATEAGGVVRDPRPCSACGRPKLTLLVPADDVPKYEGKDGEEKPFVGTLSATVCLACDGGFEWHEVKA